MTVAVAGRAGSQGRHMKSGMHRSPAAHIESLVHAAHFPASVAQSGRFGSGQSRSPAHSTHTARARLQCGLGIVQSASEAQIAFGGGGICILGGGMGGIGFGAGEGPRSMEPVSPVVQPLETPAKHRAQAVTRRATR